MPMRQFSRECRQRSVLSLTIFWMAIRNSTHRSIYYVFRTLTLRNSSCFAIAMRGKGQARKFARVILATRMENRKANEIFT